MAMSYGDSEAFIPLNNSNHRCGFKYRCLKECIIIKHDRGTIGCDKLIIDGLL